MNINELNSQALKNDIQKLLNNILDNQDKVGKLISNYQKLLEQIQKVDGIEDGNNPEKFWLNTIYFDVLQRIQIFLQKNLIYIETLGLVSLTRYIFETSVWVKLINLNNLYSLIYKRELLKNQLDYFKSVKKEYNREIHFFKKIKSEEDRQLKSIINKTTSNTSAEEIRQLQKNLMDETDKKMSEKFSIFGRAAQTNGLGFQIHLIEKNIEKIDARIAELQQLINAPIEGRLLPLIQTNQNNDEKWSWFQSAKKVGMKSEYEFVYCYTSQFIHAVPSSLTTDQKNLELDEINIFLNYIDYRISDLIRLSEENFKNYN